MSKITREAKKRCAALKGRIPVDPSKIRTPAFLSGSWIPEFYTDLGFTCKDCGKQEIWTASQQKWWYEVAGGILESTAVIVVGKVVAVKMPYMLCFNDEDAPAHIVP